MCLQLLLHVDGQKNLSFFLVPGCFFLHLFLGFSATYDSHVLEELPLYLNEAEFSHVPHFVLHVDGQKNLSFLLVPGCSFLHLLLGFSATYESHVIKELPSYPNEAKFSHGLRSLSISVRRDLLPAV